MPHPNRPDNTGRAPRAFAGSAAVSSTEAGDASPIVPVMRRSLPLTLLFSLPMRSRQQA